MKTTSQAAINQTAKDEFFAKRRRDHGESIEPDVITPATDRVFMDSPPNAISRTDTVLFKMLGESCLELGRSGRVVRLIA